MEWEEGRGSKRVYSRRGLFPQMVVKDFKNPAFWASLLRRLSEEPWWRMNPQKAKVVKSPV